MEAKMTVSEARTVLHKVVNSLKAARALEEALEVAGRLEQIVEGNKKEVDRLNGLIGEIHLDLKPIQEDIEKEKEKRDRAVAETRRIIEAGRVKVKAAEGKIEEIEQLAAGRSEELEKSHLGRMKVFKGEIEDREQVLASIETKIQDAKKALAVIRDRLS